MIFIKVFVGEKVYQLFVRGKKYGIKFIKKRKICSSNT